MTSWLSEPDTMLRSGLRELNDLTTARLETTLQERITQCERRLEQRLAALESRHWTDLDRARQDFDERLFMVFMMVQVPLVLVLLMIGIAGRR